MRTAVESVENTPPLPPHPIQRPMSGREAREPAHCVAVPYIRVGMAAKGHPCSGGLTGWASLLFHYKYSRPGHAKNILLRDKQQPTPYTTLNSPLTDPHKKKGLEK